MTRPSEMWSSEATSLASTSGSRWITRQIPVLSMIRLVTAAAAASATKGSCVCVFLGKLTTAWECGSSTYWNMCMFIEKYRVETTLFHSSGQVYDRNTIVGRERCYTKSRHTQLSGKVRLARSSFPGNEPRDARLNN